MSRAGRRERALRRRAQAERAMEHYQNAPEYDRGVAILLMWANAVVETVLYAVLALLIPLAARRAWRNRWSGPVRALRGGSSTTLLWVIGARFAYHRAVKRWLLPVVERRLSSHPESSQP
ncbi:MAG: hypothetical protein ACLQDY_20450 [Streptosporangiaceae bacterium]